MVETERSGEEAEEVVRSEEAVDEDRPTQLRLSRFLPPLEPPSLSLSTSPPFHPSSHPLPPTPQSAASSLLQQLPPRRILWDSFGSTRLLPSPPSPSNTSPTLPRRQQQVLPEEVESQLLADFHLTGRDRRSASRSFSTTTRPWRKTTRRVLPPPSPSLPSFLPLLQSSTSHSRSGTLYSLPQSSRLLGSFPPSPKLSPSSFPLPSTSPPLFDSTSRPKPTTNPPSTSPSHPHPSTNNLSPPPLDHQPKRSSPLLPTSLPLLPSPSAGSRPSLVPSEGDDQASSNSRRNVPLLRVFLRVRGRDGGGSSKLALEGVGRRLRVRLWERLEELEGIGELKVVEGRR